jgi:hypothetical protein
VPSCEWEEEAEVIGTRDVYSVTLHLASVINAFRGPDKVSIVNPADIIKSESAGHHAVLITTDM